MNRTRGDPLQINLGGFHFNTKRPLPVSPELNLKYHDSINDAVADLGKPEAIRKIFTGFQKFLYQGQTRVTSQ